MVVRVAILGACTAATMRALSEIQGAEVVVVGDSAELMRQQEEELQLERLRSTPELVVRCAEPPRVELAYYALRRERTHPTTARELRRAERGRRGKR